MSSVKRVSDNYTIETVGSGNITLNSGNVVVSNVLETNTLKVTFFANLNGVDLSVANVSASGNVTGAVFIGDGSGLTGIPAGNALGNIISYGTSNVAIPDLSGNVRIGVGGTGNVVVITTGGANVNGNLAADNYYWSNGTPFTGGGTITYDVVAVAPVSANVGDFWFNTTNGILYQYNDDGDSEQWVDQSGVGTLSAQTSAVANTAVARDLNASVSANLYLGSGMVVTGNIQTTAGYFFGNGSFLTGVQTTATNIFSGATSLDIPTPNGDINATISGTSILSITADGIINNQANGIGNIGSSSGYFNRVFATSTSALYADLAEIYESDENYEAGTVLIFSGSKEVTVTSQSHDPRVAGVVSTNPAYLMNTKLSGVAIALTGRVPCLVKGPVNKGDLLTTSEIAGVAQTVDKDSWVPGCVVGKSLETIENSDIVKIEIAVGRY